MEALVQARDKQAPKLNQEYIERAITQVNAATSFPTIVNIGRHLMNEATARHIQALLVDAEYKVHRRQDTHGRYEVLSVEW